MQYRLSELRNIGPKSAKWLHDAGIVSKTDLRAVGPVVAFLTVRQEQPNVSLNLLWALYGALHEIDWRDLPEATKQRLLKELDV